MIHYTLLSEDVQDHIYIPKYYDPQITADLNTLSDQFHLYKVLDLIDDGVLNISTGDEIGKLAYGTGEIPFVRTSDISNWEIKSSPKQGVSEQIYEDYARKQDVKPGDILLVRDGTYLIGTNCFVTRLDEKILYQSHLLKIRINKPDVLTPEIFFLALNSDIVQRQIRSRQFTADIIDTLGQRFNEVIIPVPKSEKIREKYSAIVLAALETRVKGKAFIKQCPSLIEETLVTNSVSALSKFYQSDLIDIKDTLVQDTITLEFGEFESYWKSSDTIKNGVFLPKYYAPSIDKELKTLANNCYLKTLGELKVDGTLEYYTGDEIGKMAYGTGDIPFIRTSDFANWEIKHDPKQGISEQIYSQYNSKEDVQVNDILLVRDGTYLVGSSCIVTEEDAKCLFCGGLFKLRVNKEDLLDPWILLGLLNSYIVKRQLRTKQFTRDVIDTLGNRIDEVILPIPKDKEIRVDMSKFIRLVVEARVEARNVIKNLVTSYHMI